jgi:hypothetical protein
MPLKNVFSGTVKDRNFRNLFYFSAYDEHDVLLKSPAYTCHGFVAEKAR